jgi:hypothetical protein
MKLTNLCLSIITTYALIAITSSQGIAQLTGPPTVSLLYRFHKGQQLEYQKTEEIRDPSQPGSNTSNYDIHEKIQVKVIDADSLGNATLLVTNDEQFDWLGGDDGTSNPRGVSVGTDIPQYQVKVDRIGTFLDGRVLKWSTQDSSFHEKMKQPGFNGYTPPDSSRIKVVLKTWLIPRPERNQVSDGTTWSDTSGEAKPLHSFNLGAKGPSAATEKKSGPPMSYMQRMHHYAVVEKPDDLKAGEFRIFTNGSHEQGLGYKVYSGTEVSDERIRISDGLMRSRNEVDNSDSYSLTTKLILVKEE